MPSPIHCSGFFRLLDQKGSGNTPTRPAPSHGYPGNAIGTIIIFSRTIVDAIAPTRATPPLETAQLAEQLRIVEKLDSE